MAVFVKCYIASNDAKNIDICLLRQHFCDMRHQSPEPGYCGFSRKDAEPRREGGFRLLSNPVPDEFTQISNWSIFGRLGDVIKGVLVGLLNRGFIRHEMRRGLQTVGLCLLVSATQLLGVDYFVSPQGIAGASGQKNDPFGSVEDALVTVGTAGRAAGCTVWLEDGIYSVKTPQVMKSNLSGEPGNPFRLAAVNPGKVVLSGAFSIPQQLFKAPSDPARIRFFQPQAAPHILAADLSGTEAGKFMKASGNRAMIISDGYWLPLACWPNRGYAHIDKILDKGAVWMPGRTKGKKPVESFERPIGGEFTLIEKFNGNWADEIAARIGEPETEGYLAADWFFESHHLAKVNSGGVKLLDASRYGAQKTEELPRRVRFKGLLSELDEPGEWFWDKQRQTLYLWPISPSAPVEVAAPITLVKIEGATDILLQGIAFEGAGDGVRISEGSRVTIAGCFARLLSGAAFSISGGKDHQILSCDIHDVNTPVNVAGRDLSKASGSNMRPEELLSPDGFVIDNNHIWHCRDTRGCHVAGIGWKFTHNLIHDLPGGALLWGGNDNLIAMNEFYDVMSTLGDWGVIYTGATWWTHGNVIRNNFTHNVINMPQAHGISGFYYDDLKQGDTTEGNVFYKVAHRTVKLGGGAAQTVVNNVFIDCFIDITTDAINAARENANRKKYESGELKQGDKGDYWGRTERVVGKDGWKNAPWTKYPLFRQAMELDPYSPVLCYFARNYEVGTLKEKVFLNKVPEGMVKYETPVEIRSDDFVDPERLNFAFKPGFQPMPGFEPIPFGQIGLVKNQWRPNPPEKDSYRSEANRRNAGRKCYDSDAKYDPVLDNKRLHPAPAYLLDTKSLLFPVGSRKLRQAQGADCANNLRRTGELVFVYAGENDGHSFP